MTVFGEHLSFVGSKYISNANMDLPEHGEVSFIPDFFSQSSIWNPSLQKHLKLPG